MKLSIIILTLSLFSIVSRAQFLEPTPKADVYKSINEYRVAHGLQPFQVSKKLERSSGRYALRLNIFHAEAKHAKGWINRNENCGELLGDSYRPVDGWEKSYTHNLMLLSKKFTQMGAGKSGDTYVLRLR